jgi:hypothetical protein
MLADYGVEPVQLLGRRLGVATCPIDSGDGLTEPMARRRQRVGLGNRFGAPRQRV